MVIEFSVREQRIHHSKKRYIVSDSVGFVQFHCLFDEEWDGLTKTIIFKNGDVTKKVLITSDEPEFIPHEVLKAGEMFVSVIGLSADNLKKLTTKRMSMGITILKAGAQSGKESEVYEPELWERALAAIGDISDLNTSDRRNLVAAINEVADGNGNSGNRLPNVDSNGILNF